MNFSAQDLNSSRLTSAGKRLPARREAPLAGWGKIPVGVQVESLGAGNLYTERQKRPITGRGVLPLPVIGGCQKNMLRHNSTEPRGSARG